MNAGLLDSAEIYSIQAIRDEPYDDNPFNTLGNIYMIEKKHSDALHAFKQAYYIDPSNCHYPANIGLCYINARQFDSAICYLKKSIQIDPMYDKPIELVAYVFEVIGQKDSLKKYENMAQQITSDFNVKNIYIPNCGYYK